MLRIPSLQLLRTESSNIGETERSRCVFAGNSKHPDDPYIPYVFKNLIRISFSCSQL